MKHLRLLLPLLLAAACTGDPAGIDTDGVKMTVSVDPATPPVQYNATVLVRNESSRPIYVLNHCGNIVGAGLERREGGRWVAAPGGVICFAAYTPPIELAPGETVTGAIPIDQPGVYRSTVRIAHSPEAEEVGEVRREFGAGVIDPSR